MPAFEPMAGCCCAQRSTRHQPAGCARRRRGYRRAWGGCVRLRRAPAQAPGRRRAAGAVRPGEARQCARRCRRAALGNPPQIAAALTVVATQRAAHARALSTEIARAAGKLSSSSSSETASPSPTEPGAPPPPPPPLADVVNSLRASAESASRLVATASGYRAGLLGSIAASCTASYTVALVPAGPTP